MMRLAILISGSGTTAEAILKTRLPGITPVIVISSRPDAPGLIKAKRFGVPTAIVDRNRHDSEVDFGKALLAILVKYKVDLVSQNGWLPMTPVNVIEKFRGRIINQHPGPLDPGRVDFGGKGMYGRRVTAARIEFCRMAKKDYWTEATVHHVTEAFDNGPIIRVERLDFSPSSRIETVTKALLPLEHKNVLAVLAIFGRTGRFPAFERKRPLIGKNDIPLVLEAKRQAT